MMNVRLCTTAAALVSTAVLLAGCANGDEEVRVEPALINVDVTATPSCTDVGGKAAVTIEPYGRDRFDSFRLVIETFEERAVVRDVTLTPKEDGTASYSFVCAGEQATHYRAVATGRSRALDGRGTDAFDVFRSFKTLN